MKFLSCLQFSATARQCAQMFLLFHPTHCLSHMYLPVSSLIVGVDNSRLMERFLLLSSGVYSPAEVLGNLFWLLSLRILHTKIFIMNLLLKFTYVKGNLLSSTLLQVSLLHILHKIGKRTVRLRLRVARFFHS